MSNKNNFQLTINPPYKLDQSRNLTPKVLKKHSEFSTPISYKRQSLEQKINQCCTSSSSL